MRKFLFVILAVLILVLTFLLLRDGLSIGNIKVLGISEIQSLNDQVDLKIAEAKELTEVKFNSENDKLNQALTDVAKERENYETALAQSSKEDIEEALRKEKYEIEKLWISVGNYADEHNVKVNMQITNSSSGISEVKDLKFTVNGSYVGITEFIYDLEDDPELEFKIENFNMLPDVEKSNLKSTFTVKDINVNISNISTASETSTETVEETTENTINNDKEQ